jgi:1,2-diacylglycerol 3-alpha-glucosyltransferase
MDGVGMTAHSYAHWLSTKYGTSVMVAPKVKGYKDRAGYKVVRFKSVLMPGMNPYRIGLPMLDFTFKKKLKASSFDVLHAHCPFISGQLALKYAKLYDIPLVTTFHTKYKEDFLKTVGSELVVDFLMKYTMEFYHAADHVWVPNHATGKTLREYGFTGEFEIMPNGTDIEIPEKSKYLKLRNRGLEEIDADDKDFILLFVGQHRWEKNVKTIIDALKILKDRKEKFKMVFVGEGYAEKEMKKLVKSYELMNQVVFTGVITDRTKIMNLYACADLFVFPSLYDNAPLVMREAAAFDVPSIVVKATSSAEGVIDNVNGFLISNSPQSLADKITELKLSPDAIKRAGDGARKSIYRHWESIVDDVAQRYEEIMRIHAEKHPRKESKKVPTS